MLADASGTAWKHISCDLPPYRGFESLLGDGVSATSSNGLLRHGVCMLIGSGNLAAVASTFELDRSPFLASGFVLRVLLFFVLLGAAVGMHTAHKQGRNSQK
jgi:hypothetical protein